MILDTLTFIGEKLSNKEILWAVGGSVMLQYYGLIDDPKDIDILVHEYDIEALDQILKGLGEKKIREKSDIYSTKYFYEYTIDGIDIDVMSGLAINHQGSIFKYIFDPQSVTAVETINNVGIPLTSLEDWYVIYQLIPGRENKVNLIENYLLNQGIQNKYLLKRALKRQLPEVVRRRIERILKEIRFNDGENVNE